MELRQFHKDGKLILRDFNPNEISPGEFGQIVQDAVTQNKVRVVVIDSDEAVDFLNAHSDIRIMFTDIDLPGSIDGLKLAAAVRD